MTCTFKGLRIVYRNIMKSKTRGFKFEIFMNILIKKTTTLVL